MNFNFCLVFIISCKPSIVLFHFRKSLIDSLRLLVCCSIALKLLGSKLWIGDHDSNLLWSLTCNLNKIWINIIYYQIKWTSHHYKFYIRHLMLHSKNYQFLRKYNYVKEVFLDLELENNLTLKFGLLLSWVKYSWNSQWMGTFLGIKVWFDCLKPFCS